MTWRFIELVGAMIELVGATIELVGATRPPRAWGSVLEMPPLTLLGGDAGCELS